MLMPTAPEILALDFASLKTLELVYRHGSFAAAATELGMNPSSVSYTIERMRKAANDRLFVRQRGVVVPTDHCRKLMKSVEVILRETEEFRDDVDFEPSKAAGEITAYITGYETALVMPGVVRRLRKEAPGIRLTLLYNYGPARDLLLNGHADIVMGPQLVNDSGIYGKEFIRRDHHLCMMDPGHPLAEKLVLSLEDIRTADHALFEPRTGWQQAPFRHAASLGVEVRKALATSDANSLGEIILGTDLLAALPSRMAERFSDHLVLRPYDFDTDMAEHMYWTAASDRSQLNRWVRTVILEEVQQG
jgi:DNA-binding transcriptional LysR family regulator